MEQQAIPLPTAPPQAIAEHLEQCARDIFDAVNSHAFLHPSEAVDQHFIPYCQFRTAVSGEATPTDIQGYRNALIRFYETYPECKMRIIDMNTNIKEQKGDKRMAQTYLNLEMTGAPPGVARTLFALMLWRWISDRGRWQMAYYEVFRGMGGLQIGTG